MSAIIDISTGCQVSERAINVAAELERAEGLAAQFEQVRDDTITECQRALRHAADEVEAKSIAMGLPGELSHVGPRFAKHWRQAADALERLRRP